jgi:Concanavalin A-like lectin/glucanases superfamily
MRRLVGLGAVALSIAAVTGVAHAAVISSWPLATNANDTADGNGGTAQNVTFSGNAAHFNGRSSKITVAYDGNLSPESANVTATVQVATTVKPGTGDHDFDLIRSAPTGNMYKIELFPRSGKSQAQCIFVGSANRVTLPGGPTLSDGTWHTITCRKTASKVTLSVDGAQVASKTITIGSIRHRSGSVFALGYKPTSSGGADFYNGAMKGVSVAIG